MVSIDVEQTQILDVQSADQQLPPNNNNDKQRAKDRKRKSDGGALSERDAKKKLRQERKLKKKLKVSELLELPVEDVSSIGALNPEKKQKYNNNLGVWIGNLAFSTKAEQLKKFLISHQTTPSAITRLKMPHQKLSGQQLFNKGFAKVYFESEDGVTQAVTLSESDFEGRKLLIKRIDNFEGRPDEESRVIGSGGEDGNGKLSGKSTHLVPNTKIFIGNLPFDTKLADVQQWFSQYGPIANVRLAQFEDSGKCRGFGHVIFYNLESAKSVINASTQGHLKVEFKRKSQDDDSTPAESVECKVKVEYGAKHDAKTFSNVKRNRDQNRSGFKDRHARRDNYQVGQDSPAIQQQQQQQQKPQNTKIVFSDDD
ncbi:hypothetical protein MIR68_006383 [Amoeboaphelidium protococcarum]|nr:hypothetical protein MIR68_006383 [Amoeboaphelidium protococcarum]